jgi:tRNA (guanosine-2'-O-)-methyltransferase
MSLLREIETLSFIERQQLISHLKAFKLDARLRTFERVIEGRTNYFTVMLENIVHPHNASAVLRSCDCFGVQTVHLVDDVDNYAVNRKVAMGASKWLHLKRYSTFKNNSEMALNGLKDAGYRIVATTPHKEAPSLSHFDISQGPAAFVFGTEQTGISSVVESLADEFITIPMVGFTESLNLSVAVAVLLQSVTARLHLSNIDWPLSIEQKQKLYLEWLRKSIPHISLIEERFFKMSLGR